MADKELLSQEEVDALLHGVLNGEVATGDAPAAAGGVSDYDFASQDTIIGGDMPALEQINARFASGLGESLFALLRRRAAVSIADSQVLNFAEYMHSLFTPTSIHVVKLLPLPGEALVVLDPRLLFTFIDQYFGGSGRVPGKFEAREFTRTENALILQLLERLLADLASAWAPLLEIEIEHQRQEETLLHAPVIGARQSVIVNAFEVQLDGSGGTLHVVLPCSMLEPIRGQLDAGLPADAVSASRPWRHALRDELKSTEVELVCRLAAGGLKFADVMALRKGDVIPIESPQAVTLCCRDVPVYQGLAGVAGDHRAVRITRPAATRAGE